MFPVHTLDTAPDNARPALQTLNGLFGFIPNIAGVMATSPVLVNSLVDLFGRVHGGSFSEAQIQVLLLTNAVTNRCAWAVAFHSSLAAQQGIDPADIDAIRGGNLPENPEMSALSALARTLIDRRGRLDQGDIDAFIASGFSEALLLEVIAVVAASTITNYTGSVTRPPLEAEFQPYQWVG